MSEHLPFETIRSRVPLTAVLQHYGLLSTLKPRGHELVGACPIHGGTHARQFVVNLERNTWRCASPPNANVMATWSTSSLDSDPKRPPDRWVQRDPKGEVLLGRGHNRCRELFRQPKY